MQNWRKGHSFGIPTCVWQETVTKCDNHTYSDGCYHSLRPTGRDMKEHYTYERRMYYLLRLPFLSFLLLKCPPYLPISPFFSLSHFVLSFLYFLLSLFLIIFLTFHFLIIFIFSLPFTFILSLKPVAGRVRNTYGISVGELEGKSPLGRPRRRRVDNIIMELREMWWGGVDWINLAQERDQLRVLLNTVMKLRVPQNVCKFLSSWATDRFSRRPMKLVS
jgi:hypothetical protein